MALPTSYTEAAFALFLHAQLSRVAAELGWSDGGGADAGSYGEIINDTLLACQVDAISSIEGRNGIQQLRTVGRYFAWRAAVEALTTEHDLSADGASLSRSAVFEQALKMLDRAELETAVYGIGPQAGSYVATVTAVSRTDPYS